MFAIISAMDEYDLLLQPDKEQRAATRRPASMVAAGLLLLIVGVIGVLAAILWPERGVGSEEAALPTASIEVTETGEADSAGLSFPTATPLGAWATPTLIPPPTRIAPPSSEAPEPSAIPAATNIPSTAVPSAGAGPTVDIETTPPEIEWTTAEKNALGWLCYGEVGGMGSVKVDACLSVISTVRMRYAYPNSFPETDVISTILRPGQFNVTVYTDQPGPDADLNWAVEQYQYGMRGSCNAFLFFDSVAGGPSLCTIYASNGQWIEFHNGWN